MTKRKAIEAALRRYDDDGSAENLAEFCLNTGIVLGLRMAADFIAPGDDPEATDEQAALNETLELFEQELCAKANRLAKKARAKK